MPVPPTVTDYEWLTSEAAIVWLELVAQAQGSLVSLASRLRSELSPARAHLVIEQIELRRRARKKFRLTDSMFFTPSGLQQSTDQWVACHKAVRFASQPRVVDLCCGLGGDLMALAQNSSTVGVELSAELAVLARANGRVVHTKPTEIIQEDATRVDLSSFDAWHADPDRRTDGRRATRLERYVPGIDFMQRLLESCLPGAIKLAPATAVPPVWEAQAELEWISRGGDCRQQVAWFGELARHVGQRTASRVLDNGAVHSVTGTANEPLSVAHELGRYIFEPDPAVLAARMTGQLAARHQLQAVAPSVAYLTGDRHLEDMLVTSFEITDVMPFDRRRLKAILRERHVGQLEVKKRGVQDDPARVARQLRVDGEQSATLLLMPKRGSTVAVLAKRCVSGE